MDAFLVHLGVPITPRALQIRCGPPTIGARHGDPVGRTFRCFNGSLLSITIGFMDEQVPRYEELSLSPSLVLPFSLRMGARSCAHMTRFRCASSRIVRSGGPIDFPSVANYNGRAARKRFYS